MTELERVQQLKKYFLYLEGIRKYWDGGIWQDVADYAVPLRSNITTSAKGTAKGTKIYDGTAVWAINLAADGIHGYVLNPSMVWFTFKLPRILKFIENEASVRQWIQTVQEIIYATFADSNFYSEMRPFLRDCLGFGTSIVFPEEIIGERKLTFHSLHPRECYIAEDKYGFVDTLFRKEKLNAKQAEEEFGKEKLSQRIQSMLKDNPYSEHEFLHAVFPRRDYNSKSLNSINKKFASIWVECNDNRITKESGFDIFPYMAWRYARNPDGPYGDSPLSFALPEIKSLNSISKDTLAISQRRAFPPFNVPVEMKGLVRLVPDGLNYYGSDFNRRIAPVLSGSDFTVAQYVTESKKDIIEKHFNVDLFLMLQRATGTMTAREVMERMGEKAAVLGAAIGDLTVVLDKIIDYVCYLEFNARPSRIPPLPDVLVDAMVTTGTNKLDIVYMGPLAQAQQRMFKLQPIQIGLELTAPLLTVYPDAADIINFEQAVKTVLLESGYPQDAINSPETVMAIRQEKARAAAEGMQKLDAERSAEIIKKLSQARKNSPETFAKFEEMLAGMGTMT